MSVKKLLLRQSYFIFLVLCKKDRIMFQPTLVGYSKESILQKFGTLTGLPLPYLTKLIFDTRILGHWLVSKKFPKFTRKFGFIEIKNLYTVVTSNKATQNKGTYCLICLKTRKFRNKATCLIWVISTLKL